MVLLNHPQYSDRILHWTLLLSMLVHIVAIYLIPKISYTPEQEPKILTVELAPPPPPVAPPAPEQPIKQEPIKPQPVKPLAKKIPTPVVEKSPEVQNEAEPPPPNIIAAPPKPEAPAPVVVPQPVEPIKPAPPPPPRNVDYDSLSNQYAKLISREVAKYKQYPRIAQMRGWQGEAIIQILVDGTGKVLESKIQTSSGYEVLDKQAIKMITDAVLPLPPEALRIKPISILIPISFKLE